MFAPLLVAFVLVPLAEIYVLVRIGEAFGAWQTVVLLLAWSAFGAWLVRREGRRAWRAVQTGLHEGRVPAREVIDGALMFGGGLLLLTPGFITDAFGLLLVLPVTRPLVRRMATRWLARRTITVGQTRSGRAGVIDGEIVDEAGRGRRKR